MTNSAKQDAKQAKAEPAEPESVATTAGAGAGAGPQDDVPPADAAGATDDAPPADDAKPDAGDKPDMDEMKRKFREALDRKHQAHADSQARGSRDSGKISGTHGPAASRRNFRRKSG